MGNTGTMTALQQLSASVGQGGTNRTGDVQLVQHLINAKMPISMARLQEDGICGADTIMAIMIYQQRALGMNPPDGRVDVGGRTIGSLLSNAATGVNTGAPAPVSTTVTPTAAALGVFPVAVIQAAVASLQAWKVPASVTLAQWALESNWGKAMPAGSNNPFGIKAAAGQASVDATTLEVIQGKTITIVGGFRKFASLTEAFDQHGRLLATASPYKNVMTHISDPDAFADALTFVYATAPNYGTVLKKIMKQYNLYQYDKQ